MDKKETAIITVVGGIVIFIIHLYTYLISGSIALLSNAMESIVNILASFMMLMSVRISAMPADEEHMYGHQKVENISAFVEGGLVVVAALFIGQAALSRLYEPVHLNDLNVAVGISLFATSLNGGLSWLLMRKARETNSMALEGDSKHLLSDVVSAVGVAIGLIASEYLDLPILDPVIAMVVAVLILRMGIDVILKASQSLMDKSAPEAEKKIREVLERHKSQYLDFHDLKTRRSGNRVFAEVHMLMDEDLSVKESHSLTEHLEQDLKNEVPEVEITIHVEPSKRQFA
jgi:cation diffusion facilitator family transporter